MLERVVEAVRGAGASRVAVVGGAAVRHAGAAGIDSLVDESPSGAQNLLRALRAWPPDGPLLYATSDLPYVSAPAVREFLANAGEGALAVPLTDAAAFERRFPGAPPFGITLAGERVVNGGVFLIPAAAIAPLERVATRFFDARKRPWRMAGLVSPLILLRFLLRSLRIADLETAATRALGVTARAVRGCAAELAFDVDGLAEYAYARDHP